VRSQALDLASRRIVWVRLGGLAIALLLAGRAGHLTVAHTRARTLYDQQIQTEQRLSAARGTIFDRTGRELAITTEAESIYALPRLIEDRAAAASALSNALGADLAYVARRLTAHEGFTYIARWVEPDVAERVRALELPGIGIDREPRRSYPADELAAPLLGFANIDGQGVRGIEQLEDDWLTGRPRRVRVERDARGRALALHSTDPRDVQGGDVALTLDAVMQGAAEAALLDAVKEHDALGGLVLTLDPKNGDVLALAEAPGFDPNQFRHLKFHETRSRAFSDAVEAGSTMKAFLVAAALDARAVTPDQTFDTEEGFIRVRGKTIRDRRPFGVVTPSDILRVSSNVGAVQVAQTLGREAQHAGLLRFGFGARTRSRFPLESAGILRDWQAWQPVDQAAIAYGQGISITGIQLASALGALANDGIRMEPRLVLARRRTGGAWQTSNVRAHGRAVSARAARLTLDMMHTVVSPEGTGRLAGLAGVPVAGKTGTAQKLDVELGTYSKDRYIAWFIGVVPADDPELAIVVAVDEPAGRMHSGGGVAAPLFARVAAAQLARRGIVTEPQPIPAAPIPEPPPVLTVDTVVAPAAPRESASPSPHVPAEIASVPTPAKEITASAPSRVAPRIKPPRVAVAAPPAGPVAQKAAGPSPSLAIFDVAFVPDFQGSTMARARRIADSESLEITTLGAIEGMVVSQSPVPGTVLDGNDRTVRLRFEPPLARAPRREEG
jgi:cell division protein FtsI (penicillin-binding protein 3)